MTYAEKQLAPGETILHRARYHWIFFGRPILLTVLSIAASALAIALASKGAGAGVTDAVKILAGALFVAALVLFAVRGLRAHADEFVVTDRRILHKIGVFGHETRQCPLERIQDITVDQSFWGRLLGYGDLAIETASEKGQILFPTIRDPEALRTAIWTHVGPGGVSAAAPVSAAAAASASRPGSPSASERLARLNELKNQGLLTPEEFEAKRREIVREL